MTDATISRKYDFEAAHFLPKVREEHKCRNIHGHSYTYEVFVTGPVQESGPEEGMVVDFDRLDSVASALKRQVDHTLLNESLHANPTVELVTPLVYARFAEALPGLRVDLVFNEGPRSSCECPPRPRNFSGPAPTISQEGST